MGKTHPKPAARPCFGPAARFPAQTGRRGPRASPTAVQAEPATATEASSDKINAILASGNNGGDSAAHWALRLPPQPWQPIPPLPRPRRLLGDRRSTGLGTRRSRAGRDRARIRPRLRVPEPVPSPEPTSREPASREPAAPIPACEPARSELAQPAEPQTAPEPGNSPAVTPAPVARKSPASEPPSSVPAASEPAASEGGRRQTRRRPTSRIFNLEFPTRTPPIRSLFGLSQAHDRRPPGSPNLNPQT